MPEGPCHLDSTVTKTTVRQCWLPSFVHFSWIFWLRWKKWTMAEPMALVPPGRADLGMAELWHCQNAGTVATYSYCSYCIHEPKTFFLIDDIDHDSRPDRQYVINYIAAPVGDHPTGIKYSSPTPWYTGHYLYHHIIGDKKTWCSAQYKLLPIGRKATK